MFINGKISQYHILPLDSFSRLKLSNGNDTFDITDKTVLFMKQLNLNAC